MIPHHMTLFKFICVQYQFHRQTLPIMKIDRGQIQFRDYVSTGTEPEAGIRNSQDPYYRGAFNIEVYGKIIGARSFGRIRQESGVHKIRSRQIILYQDRL